MFYSSGRAATYNQDMTDVLNGCVNHPGTPTRLSCTTCGDPICTRCMRQGAVGQKCPSCARQPRSARAKGKPRDYVRLSLAAPIAVIAGGLFYSFVIATVSFGSLILAGLLGFGIGRVVRWAVRGQTQQPFMGIAAVAGVITVGTGLFFAGAGVIPAGVFSVLAYVVSGWFAVRGLQG